MSRTDPNTFSSQSFPPDTFRRNRRIYSPGRRILNPARSRMKASLAALSLVVLALLMGDAQAFDNDELEIFDLVEEVNQNFYEYLGLDVDGKATTNEIRKAYKKLALVWHPDKSDAEDAEVSSTVCTYCRLFF